MSPRHKVIAACLSGVVASLLVVGIVSETFVRHVIQVVPIGIALVAVTRRVALGPYFAIPIFALWLLLMVLIWLYLIGIQTFFTGTFSLAEVVLTILIGLFSVLGIVACAGSRVGPGAAGRSAAVITFAALQVGAMWVSFLRPFANR
jgi:hypothetical protein